jgi:hypothetical protein
MSEFEISFHLDNHFMHTYTCTKKIKVPIKLSIYVWLALNGKNQQICVNGTKSYVSVVQTCMRVGTRNSNALLLESTFREITLLSQTSGFKLGDDGEAQEES